MKDGFPGLKYFLMTMYKMPLIYIAKRKSAPRRKMVRRKRMARRPVYKKGPFRPLYSYKRSVFTQDAIVLNQAGTLSDQGLGWNFRFNQLPGTTDFTSLYDQYMIKKIVVKIIPRASENPITPGASSTDLQQIHSVIDYDDSAAPSSIQELVQYQSYKVTRGNQVHTRVFVPRIALTTDNTKKFQWVDLTNTAVPHYGLKTWIAKPTTPDTTVSYDMLVTYYFTCKDVR